MSYEMKRSDWCEINVMVDGKPIDFRRFPWVVKPLDSHAPKIAIKKGAQIGFSIMLVCRALYDCLVDGKNVMIVQPTAHDAKDFQSRVVAIIDDLPEDMEPTKMREGLIQFPNGSNLYIRSSGGKTSVRSVPVDTVLVDEVSAIHTLKLSQAMSRLDASESKTFIACSTPDYPGRGISALYLDGDQQTWRVLCPSCGDRKPIVWEDSFTLYADAPERSFAKCSKCHCPRTPDRQWDGEWIASSDAPVGSESYHVGQLVSRTVSYKEMAEAAVAAHRHPDLHRNFVNEKLGLDYIPNDSTRLHLWQVRACVQPYGNATLIPSDAQALHVLGMDQGVRNSFVVARFDFPMSGKHAIDAAAAIIVDVGAVAEGDWAAIEELQRQWQSWVTVIDRAGSSKVGAQEFARNSPYATWLAEYEATPQGILEFAEKEQPSGWMLCKTNRTWALSVAHQRIKTKRIALPSDAPEQFYQQLTNAALDSKGERYVKTGDDHWLHALAYCEIGLRLGLRHFGSSIVRTRAS